jgi:site-specific recombinase XerD
LNHGRSERTVWTYQNCLRWFGEWLVSIGMIWATVQRGNVEQWIADMRAAGRHPKSINSRVGAVKGFYRWLKDEGHIDKNPFEGLSPIKIPKSLPRVLSRFEIEAMLAAAKTPREKMAVELLYSCGVRRQGLLDIRLQDIDLKSRLIKIHHKGAKERLVVMGHSAVLAILRWLPHRAMIARNFERDEGYLFVGREGQLSGQRMLDMIHAVAGRAKVDRVHCHALRHTCASHMRDGGADLEAIREQLGHESLATTGRYLHTSVEQRRQDYDRTHPMGGS